MNELFNELWELNDEIFRLADTDDNRNAEIKKTSIQLSGKLIALAKELELNID